MLQLDLPLEDFHAYCRTRPELGHIVEDRQGRMLRCPTLWEDTVKVIATSNTTWAQTIAMTSRLTEHFGASLPSDPARHAFPTPRNCCRSVRRVRGQSPHGLSQCLCPAIATHITDGSSPWKPGRRNFCGA